MPKMLQALLLCIVTQQLGATQRNTLLQLIPYVPYSITLTAEGFTIQQDTLRYAFTFGMSLFDIELQLGKRNRIRWFTDSLELYYYDALGIALLINRQSQQVQGVWVGIDSLMASRRDLITVTFYHDAITHAHGEVHLGQSLY